MKKDDKNDALDITKELDSLNKKKNTKSEKGFSLYSIVKIMFFVLLVIISLCFCYSVIKTKMIPGKFITLFVVVLLLINAIVGLLELTQKKWVNAIGFALILLMIPVMFIGINYINKTMNIMQEFFVEKEEKTTYYIISNKGEFVDINSLDGKIVGVLTEERKSIEDEISKTIILEYKEYDIIGELIVSLQLNEIDAMVISVSLYEYILEENPDLAELIEKIGELEVVGKPTSITSDIDIGNSFLIYLSGIDSRDTSSLSPYSLSDVNILIAVNPTTHKVLLIHIPRDYYVQLHGKTGLKDKLTHAGLYGIGMSMNTVGDIFNINVNTYIKVNFAAVTNIVDAIGGIDVYSDITFNSYHMKGWTVQKGMNHMDGAKALAFARERYAYSSGDRHRGENQEAVITAIIKKVSTNKEYLLQYDKILETIQPYFVTNFKMEDVQDLIKSQVDTLSPWTVESYNVNGSNGNNVTYSWPTQYSYVMIPNQSTIDTAKSKIIAIMSDK